MKTIIQQSRNTLASIQKNLNGTSMSQKLLVIESDDWGSIRTPSKQAQQSLSTVGIDFNKSAYLKFDSLETNSDLELLLDVLTSVKDNFGNSAILTANTVVGNPNFEAIRQSNFLEYHYEPFTESLKKYTDSDNVFNLYGQGIRSGAFIPQFHGREHVNVPLWLELLQSNHPAFQLAFDQEFWGISSDVLPLQKGAIQATYDHVDATLATESLVQGLTLFEELFGYKSSTFIPNNYVLDSQYNALLKELGVHHFQGMKLQFSPRNSEGIRARIRRKNGNMNAFQQTQGVRNCNFEPTEKNDTPEKVLSEISTAFFLKKPAIICTHRINFAGRLSEKNRDKNLTSLKQLLKTIIQKWPDVRFISSHQLQQLLHGQTELSPF